jgi:hypothetical protein
VYKLGKNWQTRAWDPVFKTAESAPDAAMILGNWRTLLINLRIVIKKNGCCFYKEKLHTNGFCLFCFLGFARRIFYPALGYFHKKILRLTLIVSYIELFIFILIFVVPHQNDIATTKIMK